MIGFKTSDFNNTNPNDDDYNHPFFKLINFLWPGDWREQLSKLNGAICDITQHIESKGVGLVSFLHRCYG